jgi:dTDP-4-amino-4,6-dideoxygalactose transaminase
MKEMKESTIPVFKPLIGKDEKEACLNVLDVGWLGMGKNVGEFEEAVKRHIEADDRYVVAVSTGHAAIHLGLLLMGIGPGDEVITPSFNNAADFQAILATGASPVLCDIEEHTLNIDIEKAEALITENTKAIIVMDYDCILCDHDKIIEIANKHNIRILHDAAHSFGSKYKGRKIGSFSDITMFSFDPVKTITCLDGGILVVKTKEEMHKLHEMRLVGMGQPAEVMYQNTRAWTYDMKHLGYRYHMSNMHAAIGLAQLSKIKEIEESRRESCRYYNTNLNSIDNIIIPKTDFNDITPFLYYIRVPSKIRDEFRKYLLENGIDTGIHWQLGHWFSLLKDAKRGDLSVTEQIGHEILSLPLHSCMATNDIEKIVKFITLFFMDYNDKA